MPIGGGIIIRETTRTASTVAKVSIAKAIAPIAC